MIISEAQRGARLDHYLVQLWPNVSRANIQKLIASGSIQVNGKTVPKHYFLKVGDSLDVPAPPSIKLMRGKITPTTAVPLALLALHDDYIVLNKPAGIAVHPSSTMTGLTLVHGLVAQFPELAQVGDDPLRPGIVHRLDRDVSGVLVVARTTTMFELLKQQFQNRTIHKRYLALVHGTFSQATGQITFGIERSKQYSHKMAALPSGQGKAAVTEYEVLQQYQQYTYIALNILTGRTHQIRVHLNAIGHPVVGDAVYKPKKFTSRLQPQRLFLHASVLTFQLPNGQTVTYQAPLPKELQLILDDLT
ncbi:MAG: RluA family pseudouridine synthase [Candidatus Kerfeldbacteria bacterium]|nr:RluA family pseudouridine synthase [Candidatus Kerfeldbacteria bacterium]